jgi:hypothetical protein
MPFPPDNPLVTTLYKQAIRAMIQRDIFDATGRLLDVRTCWVIWDANGDPHKAVSPHLAHLVLNDEAALAELTDAGYTLSPGQP